MSKRRSLDAQEQALWDKVVQTVTPLHPNGAAKESSPAESKFVAAKKPEQKSATSKKTADAERIRGKVERAKSSLDFARDGRSGKTPDSSPAASHNLDSHWDRRFRKGVIEPDVSIDLHGTGLAGAYQRLDSALEQAVHQHLRVILLVTGKPRSHDRASGQGRGAIAAVVRDWLAASRHASNISAVKNAHPRHGGGGALYIILKRR